MGTKNTIYLSLKLFQKQYSFHKELYSREVITLTPVRLCLESELWREVL